MIHPPLDEHTGILKPESPDSKQLAGVESYASENTHDSQREPSASHPHRIVEASVDPWRHPPASSSQYQRRNREREREREHPFDQRRHTSEHSYAVSVIHVRSLHIALSGILNTSALPNSALHILLYNPQFMNMLLRWNGKPSIDFPAHSGPHPHTSESPFSSCQNSREPQE